MSWRKSFCITCCLSAVSLVINSICLITMGKLDKASKHMILMLHRKPTQDFSEIICHHDKQSQNLEWECPSCHLSVPAVSVTSCLHVSREKLWLYISRLLVFFKNKFDVVLPSCLVRVPLWTNGIALSLIWNISPALPLHLSLIQQVSESAVGEQWVQGWFAHEWCLWMRVCYWGRLFLHSPGRKVCSPLPPLQRPGEILRHKGPSGSLFSMDA